MYDFFRSVRQYRLNSVLLKTFFIITGAFFMLIFLVALIVGRLAAENYREHENVNHLHMLNQTSIIMETVLEYLANDMHITMWDKNIISAMVAPNQLSFYKDSAIIARLKRSVEMNEFIGDLCFFQPNAELVYTATGVESYPNGNAQTDKLIDTYRQDTGRFLPYHSTEDTVTSIYYGDGKIILSQEFSLDRVLGVLFYVLNEERLYEIIQDSQLPQQCKILVYGSDGTAVFTSTAAYEHTNISDLNKIADLVTRADEQGDYYAVKSNILGWHYLCKNLDSSSTYILPAVLRIVLPIALLFFFICLFLSAYVTYSMFRPVKRLLLAIMPAQNPGSEKVKNEYELIRRQYDNILEENQNLQEQLENMASEVIRQILFRLASGVQLSEAYVAEAFGSMGEEALVGDRILCMVIKIREAEHKSYQAFELGLMMKGLHSYANTVPFAEGRLLTAQMDHQQLLLVFFFAQTVLAHQIRHSVISFQQELTNKIKKLPYETDIGRSDIHAGLMYLSVAYQSVLSSLNESAYPQDERAACRRRVAHILEVAAENPQMASGLSALLCDEAAEQAENDLARIRALELVIDCFLEQLIAMRIPPGNPLIISAKPPSPLSAAEMRTHAESFCLSAVEFIQSSGKKSKYKHLKDAKTYAEKHFADSDLDVSQTAEYIGLNSTYFSKLFKELEGQTFLEYLNAYRINKARQMLKTDGRSVKETALMCGFGSSQSFIRVFKKYTGQTPGEYRSE